MVFDNSWFRELPGSYTALHPTPLAGGRLLYHNAALANEMALDSDLFAGQGHGVWYGAALLPGMQPWLRFTAGISLASGQVNWAMAAVCYWVNNTWTTAAGSTGI